VTTRELPATRSDRLVDAEVTHVIEGDRCALLHTPSRPDYWDGNALLLDEAPDQLAGWFAQLDHLHPGGRARDRLRWESTDPRPPAPALPADVTYARQTVLRHARRAEPASVPAGVELRCVPRGEIPALAALALDGEPAEGPFARFLDWMYAKHARVSAATWWCAEDGGQVVAALGLYLGADLRRFQDVETLASHRRRGIASALIQRALDDAGAGPPTYIVADSDSAAERLYRRLGFEPVSFRHTLTRMAA
jgi:ribosomal protein S18 acetylase RimI-like enzyme